MTLVLGNTTRFDRTVTPLTPNARSCGLFVLLGVAAALITLSSISPVARLRKSVPYLPPHSSSLRTAGLAQPNHLPLGKISPAMIFAVILGEDARFLQHPGVDIQEIARSIQNWLTRGDRLRGASTIEQQLCRTVFLSQRRNLVRKLLEVSCALELSLRFSKTEILELYLNAIEFAPTVYGIEAAAEHYFQTTPNKLTLRQAAVLSSVIPDPMRRSRDYFSSHVSYRARVALLKRLIRLHAVLGSQEYRSLTLHPSPEELLQFPVRDVVLKAAGDRILANHYKHLAEEDHDLILKQLKSRPVPLLGTARSETAPGVPK